MTTFRWFTLVMLLVAVGARASDQIPAPRQTQAIALTGGTLYPVSGPPVTSGTVVFSDGRITALGQDVDVPADARIIDVTGKRVYPGLINAFTSIGLTEIGSVRGTSDTRETGRINPNVRVEVAINPGSEIIPVTRANGIAVALTVPSGGTIAGQSALVMLDGWTWEDMVLKSGAGLHVIWPSMTISRAYWVRQSEEEQKQERQKSLDALSNAFKDARAYRVAREAAGARGVPAQPTDLRWEAMMPALSGDQPVIVAADNIQQIQAAVAWAKREGLRLIIAGGQDAWRVSELLARENIPVIVTGVNRQPNRRWEDFDLPFALPLRLHAAGIRFCIGSGGMFGGASASAARNLPYEAAKAAAYGLPPDEALKAVTLYPAQILGVADRVESLEVDKDATLIVTDGDPLETPTQVLHMFIQGRDVDLSSRHTMLYEKYKTKYAQPR